MTHYKKSFSFLVIVSFCFVLFSPSCVKREDKKDNTIVAFVNKEPIFESDVKRNLDLQARLDPNFTVNPDTREDQLDSLIDKKLIIQEALHQGLAREEKFVNTIKTFWEQTLIREFIEFKKKEFQSALSPAQDEIQDYYDKLKKRVTFKIYKTRNKEIMDNVLNKIKNKLVIKELLWDVIGPVGYEDITSNVLYHAFDLPAGEIKMIEGLPYYYLVMVINVTEETPQPLEAMRPQIEKRIAEIKERRLFDDWLAEKRRQSEIKIIR